MLSIEKLYPIFLQHPNIVTDSRQVEAGCLFFALRGDRFNGNQFALQALEKGAAYAVVDEDIEPSDPRLLKVENTLASLQALARHHRRQFDIPIIGITGSNGKTTTKELISAVLSSHYPTHFTKGNLNNHIGVPITLLSMPEGTEVAVIEMGANHPGEIDMLCRIAEPTHGVVTNIGKAHLEGFGGLEGVKKTKSELYRFLASKDGIVFLNMDEPYLDALAQANSRKVYYQKSHAPSAEHIPVEVKLVKEQPYLEVAFLNRQGQLVHVQTRLIGSYNFNNIMTAIALGKYFKVPGEKIKQALEHYTPSNNRSQLLTIGSNTFILDAYNANPTSVKNALESFRQMKAKSKVAILGAMLELGEFSNEEHENIAKEACAAGFAQVILVGQEFKEAAKREGVLFFENTNALKVWFERQDFRETHFLVKGSRSIGLEKLLLSGQAH